MREAGLEPALPREHPLKGCVLNQTRPFAQNMKKIYCSLRGSNPRPWAHKTQILSAELKEHHNHTIFGLIFICFSFSFSFLFSFLFSFSIWF